MFQSNIQNRVTMSGLPTDLSGICSRVPHIREMHRDGLMLTIVTTFPPPCNTVQVRLSNEYVESYPYGEVSFLAGDAFHVITASEHLPIEAVCRRVANSCELLQEHHMLPSMGGCETSSWGRVSSTELHTPPTACGGGFQSGLHEELVKDLGLSTNVEVVDHPALGLCTATISVPLTTLSGSCAEAWEVLPQEPLRVVLSFSRRHYLNAPVKVEVGQDRNFTSGAFCGLPGHMRLVAQRFCDAHAEPQKRYLPLVEAGYLMEDINAVTGGQYELDIDSVRKKLTSHADSQALRAHPVRSAGFFVKLEAYIAHRLTTLSSFCAICDHIHDVPGLLRLSVCNRALCAFQFEELDVGKSFGFTTALHSGVVDLLVSFAKTAALSARWNLIFNPFPRLTLDGHVAISPETKDASIALIKEVFSKMPPTYKFLQAGSIRQHLSKAHPHAPALFQWIMSSNASQLLKLDAQHNLEFMSTPHQFLLSMNADDRVDRFNALKAKHGSTWAFHGSNGENWHSILRNGLKNASGTSLQVNGTAYGNGVYLSPNASVSFGYSHVASQWNMGGYYGNYGSSQKPQPDDGTAGFIDLESMHCIAICEVVDCNIRKSGNIWVQPDENCVLARFFFVYSKYNQNAAAQSVDLDKEHLKKILFERSAQLVKR